MPKPCEFMGSARCNNTDLQAASRQPSIGSDLSLSTEQVSSIPYFLRKLPGWGNYECKASIFTGSDRRNFTEEAMCQDQSRCPGYQPKFVEILEAVGRRG